jgi:hypothetical protein
MLLKGEKMMELFKRLIIAMFLTTCSGIWLASCSERDVSTEIKVDQDRNADGTVDTTIRRETKID